MKLFLLSFFVLFSLTIAALTAKEKAVQKSLGFRVLRISNRIFSDEENDHQAKNFEEFDKLIEQLEKKREVSTLRPL